jgi:hypothetical protein
MLRAIAAAKKKSDRIDVGKIADCLHSWTGLFCLLREPAQSGVGLKSYRELCLSVGNEPNRT